MSPLADAYLGDVATELADRVGLGKRNATDFLAIGFSALDYVGHAYGPKSHEVQDMLIRLDIVIGRLLDALDRTVGPDQYVVALTSDHGVAPLPEQPDSPGGSGRLALNPLGGAIEAALSTHFEGRAFIEAMTGSYVHFLPGVVEEIRRTPAAARAVIQAAENTPGVERAYWAWDLAATSPTSDDRLALMRRSYVAARSGDLAFQPEANWVVASGGTNHGSWHPYDSEVPLVFMGRGVKQGRYTSEATLVDVAPTLGALAGISMPKASGRVLADVIH
jgi:predicted AlkP superfamily pyrophosphatase or phosphodiesterase